MINFYSIPNRTVLARIYYGVATAFILYRYESHVLLSQLENPVLTFVNTDLTYIALSLSGLARLLTQHHTIAVAFDLCLLTSAITAFLFPSRNYLAVIFTILLGIYEVTGYTYLCFHKHNLTGLWFCSLMFWVVDQRAFTPLFNLTRYYCLFAYASSGFWKFYRGVWNLKGHFPVILKNDALSYLVEHPSGFRSHFISWLIVHPALLDNLMMLTCFVQLAFVIGFFTRRLDWFFVIFIVVFHILSYYLMAAYFLEFSTLIITLLPLSFLYKNRAYYKFYNALVGN